MKVQKHIIAGKSVRCTVADKDKKSTKIIKTRKLFIGNIPEDLPEEEIRCFFSSYG